MQISADISLYPLKKEYRDPIKTFISQLEAHSNVLVSKNSMSTTLLGDYKVLMPILEREMKTTLISFPKSMFVIKLSGGCQ